MSTLGNEARRFTRSLHNGVLSTLSRRLAGFPFGSVSPFILDHAGCPVILISELAEHTKNIDSDARVSLIVQPFSDDMQMQGRVTIVGHARLVHDKDKLGSRYLRYFPRAQTYFAMHDFHFYRIEPYRIRYIGGFGRIHWIEPEAYLCDPGQLPDEEDTLVDAMGHEYRGMLDSLGQEAATMRSATVELLGVDPDGFDLRSGEQILRREFATPVLDSAQARMAIVALAQQHRS